MYVAEISLAVVMSFSRKDVKQLHMKLRFGNDIIPLQGRVDVQGVKGDSCLPFDSHRQKTAHKAASGTTFPCLYCLLSRTCSTLRER